MDQRGDWRLTDALIYDHGRGDPFAAAVRATRMPMVITNPRLPDNPIVYCNEAFQHLSGYERDEIVGRNCRFLQGPDTNPVTVERIRTAIRGGRAVEADLLNYRKDGTIFWNALYISPVRDDEGTINYFFASQLDISDRVMAEQRAIARREEVEQEVALRTADLERALEAKTMLLHELDHRVKNNLTMIGSILRLQARDADDPAVTARLEAMLLRVDALGTVHRRLYQSADVTRFDIGAYLSDLATDLVRTAAGHIELTTDIVPIDIAPGHASAFGLVLNELLTNAIAHTSPDGRPGTLRLSTALDGNTAIIRIADNGPGLPPDTVPHQTVPGQTVDALGRTLVERLSRQIGLQTTWTRTPTGTTVQLALPLANRT